MARKFKNITDAVEAQQERERELEEEKMLPIIQPEVYTVARLIQDLQMLPRTADIVLSVKPAIPGHLESWVDFLRGVTIENGRVELSGTPNV